MNNKIMYIPYVNTQKYPSVDYNYRLKCLDTQLSEPSNQNTITVPKVEKPTIMKIYYWG